MDDNVIAFPTRNLNIQEDEPTDPVIEFILQYLIPWAIDMGIDVESQQFKLNGATIMTCLQGMLLNDI